MSKPGFITLQSYTAQPAAGGWRSVLLNWLIAGHRCSPPASMHAVPSSDGGTYECPECGQCWAGPKGSPAA